MIPQLILVLEVIFTLEAKVVVQALFIVRMEARFGLEDLDCHETPKKGFDEIHGDSEKH